jgi:hypothetical protein
MTSTQLRPSKGDRALVALVCSVPLLGEAVQSALDFADVRTFTGRRGTTGLLEWLHPDAIVVDNDDDALAARAYSVARDVPVVHISMSGKGLFVLRGGRWEHVNGDDGPTLEAVRNVVAGALFARGGGRP